MGLCSLLAVTIAILLVISCNGDCPPSTAEAAQSSPWYSFNGWGSKLPGPAAPGSPPPWFSFYGEGLEPSQTEKESQAQPSFSWFPWFSFNNLAPTKASEVLHPAAQTEIAPTKASETLHPAAQTEIYTPDVPAVPTTDDATATTDEPDVGRVPNVPTAQTVDIPASTKAPATKEKFAPTPAKVPATKEEFAPTPAKGPATKEEYTPTPAKAPATKEEYTPTPAKVPATKEEFAPTPAKVPATKEESTPAKSPATKEESVPGKEPAMDDAPTPTKATDPPATTIPPIADPSSTETENPAPETPSMAKDPNTSTTPSNKSKLCTKPRVQITEVELGAVVDANEDEAALKVVAIASMPSGGSRIAFHSGDSVIVRELDANDKLVSSSAAIEVPLHDFADIYADDEGFVILGTRDAEGGGTLNCGDPSNLCGEAPNPAVPCYDMYLVRYDGSTETWATKLTSSSASLPPYSTSKTGEDVYMIWWYAHHGRIAFDGTNWAAYFGAAISISEGGCINVHQGDRMKVVSPSGSITADQSSFDWGCSHSAYERITYDERKEGYALICKTDSGNRIMPPQDWGTTIYPVDLAANNLGDIVPDGVSSSNKYWATASNGEGDNAKVYLLHFAINAAASDDIVLGGTDANERAPHLAAIGDGGILAMWEGSSTGGDLPEGGDRTIYVQVLDSSTGQAISSTVTVDKSVVGNRYQALKSFPDGSVAYLSKGLTDTSVQVVRFFGC